MASAVVISDTHFGLASATLVDCDKVDSLVSEIWRYGQGCDQIVFLGDIFDLWRSRPEKAIRDSSYLFKKLSELDIKISYVVGNHDHHMAVMNQESEFLERIARGDIYPVYTPSMRWRQNINGLMIDTFYPVYTAVLCGRNILFTHGHHLNGMRSLYMQLEKIRRLSGEEISPADMEMTMTCVYESIYRSSYIDEMACIEECIWKASDTLCRFKTCVFGRSAPVEDQYEAIVKFTKEQQLGNVDCFVYGDTHRPGMCRKNDLLAVNTGSFIRDENRLLDREPTDTYLVIDDGCLALRQLGRREPLFAERLS